MNRSQETVGTHDYRLVFRHQTNKPCTACTAQAHKHISFLHKKCRHDLVDAKKRKKGKEINLLFHEPHPRSQRTVSLHWLRWKSSGTRLPLKRVSSVISRQGGLGDNQDLISDLAECRVHIHQPVIC